MFKKIQNWEYQIEYVEEGKEGWEIVSVISRETSKGTIFSFFFKRPKQ